MDGLDLEVLQRAREEKEEGRVKERGERSSSSSTQVESKREEVRKEVHKKLREEGLKNIQRAQAKFWQRERTKRGIFKVGDKVVVNYSLRKSLKKAAFGKGYYPYSGEIVEVIGEEGKYFRIKWGLSHPVGRKEGEVAKRRVRIDQVLHIQEGEQVELVLQHYLQADSYNTQMTKEKLPNLEEILRQRKDQRTGDLEVLCVWKNKWEPSWEWVRDVGSTQQYRSFLENFDYFEEMRRQGREEEEEEERYEVERIFYQVGEELLVLWRNFDEPGRVRIQNVKHLDVYQEWTKNGRVILEESSEEEESEEGEGEEEEEEEEEEEVEEESGMDEDEDDW